MEEREVTRDVMPESPFSEAGISSNGIDSITQSPNLSGEISFNRNRMRGDT